MVKAIEAFAACGADFKHYDGFNCIIWVQCSIFDGGEGEASLQPLPWREKLLDINEIQKYLPHRYPFLLVDRIIEIEEGKRVVGIKNVTMNEDHFIGHFPGHPVMPGVLIIEAMAQTAAVLALYSMRDRKSVV